VTAGPLDLPAGSEGVLPSQHLRRAVEAGVIRGGDLDAVQPASVDLHLGDVAYRVRCSFLPRGVEVERRLKDYVFEEIDLTGEGAVLETDRPYLIPLVERLDLPRRVRARANPKSSTGRLDVFTRVLTDYSDQFDEIRPEYRGPLWLEVVPLSFTVRVRAGLALNQLRLVVGSPAVSYRELREVHDRDPILYGRRGPFDYRNLPTTDGVYLTLDLRNGPDGRVGYRAREHAPLIDMARVAAYEPDEYWEPVVREEGDRVVLAPERFYLLLSEERVAVPPTLAAEMTAYDPTAGELRTHYAGFFDPGFGYDKAGGLRGSRAALEVRAHDVAFMVEHGQRVCRLTFERMLAEPDRLYGAELASNYQGQVETLGKHFRRAGAGRAQPSLFALPRESPR
jgi:dCTP deaminase